MSNKKFELSDFDEAEPNLGHRARFEQKLVKELHGKKINWKWLAVAASAAALITLGYYETNRAEMYSPL
tara:strand:+ start:652 stop:858 length:207 start_codon:yes stop_codon:yes gene_type:complete